MEQTQKSNYTLMEMEKSYCPNCQRKIHLIAADFQRNQPSFFICFECQDAFEVGVGPIRKVELNEE